MIKGGRFKARDDMAQTAITVGRYVIVFLALGDVAVVAHSAVVDCVAVIEVGAGEFSRVVADGAVPRRWNMCQ